MVELAEGPWLLVRLLTDDPDALRAGAPVRATFVRSGPEDDTVNDDTVDDDTVDDGGEVVVAFEPV